MRRCLSAESEPESASDQVDLEAVATGGVEVRGELHGGPVVVERLALHREQGRPPASPSSFASADVAERAPTVWVAEWRCTPDRPSRL